ncbi:MAG: c-type cytochrome [Deltaproteobacteria bacterium]|nr:c-type cytochrome [Deltaproteobacteria bacterium]
MKSALWVYGTLIGLLLFFPGCRKNPDAGGATEIDLAGAKAIFAGRCVACHGTVGKGDGPGAAALNPKPRAFSDAAWQKSVSDAQIKQTVIAGGLAVGKSALMPGNPDLKGNDAVLGGLVRIIRDFAK